MGNQDEIVVGDAPLVRANGPGSAISDETDQPERPWWSRLAASPFDVGQHDYAAFVDHENPHDLLLDRLGGPLAIQLGLIVGLITLTGESSSTEMVVGLTVAATAIAIGIVLVVWTRTLPLWFIDVGLVAAAVMIVAAGIGGGELATAVPALSVAVATALFAQRPWRMSLAFAGLLGLGYAVVLASTDVGPAPVNRWIIVMVAMLSSGFFVHWVRSKVLEVVDADLAVRERAEAAARELASVSRERSEYLGRMSHELRTPLNAILGFTSILQSGRAGPLTERQGEYLEDVKGAGLHLVDLVDEVMDLARIEASSPRLVLGPVQIGAVVRECTRLMRERATRAGVTIASDIEPGLPIVLADARRVRQVLLNLTANAVRFTPAGGSITVRAWRSSSRLCVSVVDTGVGIAPEDQERMFVRFEQGGDREGGTGLGLALARRFVEQHGGRIVVASQPGHGAAFTFWLPVRTVGEAGTADRDQTVGRPHEPESELYEALLEPGSGPNRKLIATVGRWVSLQAAALAALLALISPGPLAARAAIGAVAVAALLVMRGLPGYTERAPLIGVDLIGLVGVVGISTIAYVTGSFSELAALGYAWLFMTAFAPWARKTGTILVVSTGVAYAIVLALHAGPGSEVAQWLAIVGVLGLNGLTIRSLVQKLRAMVFAERQARLEAEAIEDELAAVAAHKDDFVGSMSHELRTPLHAIIGFSDVLAAGGAGELNADQREYVDEVRDAGRELLARVDHVLSLAKEAHRASTVEGHVVSDARRLAQPQPVP